MAKKNLPKANAFQAPEGFQWDPPSRALTVWSQSPQSAEADDPDTISIYDVIGEDPWSGEGFTTKRAAAALRRIGNSNVTVNINSPGGNMFDGLAIYNLLVDHPGNVRVRIMGLAASAASIIAMAGDEIEMGAGSMMMIHNAWGLVVGNRFDFAGASTTFETFDSSMADIYSARTGNDPAKVSALMDGEGKNADGTFMTAKDAVDLGFADRIFEAVKTNSQEPSNQVPENIMARRRIGAALAAQGISPKDRLTIINEISGETGNATARDAGSDAVRDAGTLMALNELRDALKHK